MKIYDISIPIKTGMTVYPNNPETIIEKFADIKTGSSSNLSKITMGSHNGTHLDAPLHATADAKSITDINLEKFIGNAFVYDFSHIEAGQSIKISDFEKVKTPKNGEIVLVKTSNSKRGYSEFYADFVYLDGDSADYLAEIGIKLFGIDYLSVKQKGSSDNRPHSSLLNKEIPVLEGINLLEVPQDDYEFIALPLKIEGCDGSPTRAVLIKN